MSRPFRLRHVAVAGMLLLSACTPAGTPDVSPSAGRADRIAAIQQARDRLAPPAQTLGTAAATVADRLQSVAASPQASPVPSPKTAGIATSTPTGQVRSEEIGALRDAVTGLRQAGDALAAVALDASTVDVTAAQDARTAITDRARQLAASATTVADAAAQAAAADAALAALVATWASSGSRSQLLARFQQTAASARALVADGPATCAGPMTARSAAAKFVAEASTDLQTFVRGYDGTGFDARRGELGRAPFGKGPGGTPRRLGAAIDPAGCGALGTATSAAAGVTAALDGLESALNPGDLEG